MLRCCCTLIMNSWQLSRTALAPETLQSSNACLLLPVNRTKPYAHLCWNLCNCLSNLLSHASSLTFLRIDPILLPLVLLEPAFRGHGYTIQYHSIACLPFLTLNIVLR